MDNKIKSGPTYLLQRELEAAHDAAKLGEHLKRGNHENRGNHGIRARRKKEISEKRRAGEVTSEH